MDKSKILKLGLSIPLNKAIYVDMVRAIEAMIDWDNQHGGWLIGGEYYKIQGIAYDEGATLDQATKGINKLVYEDKVKFLIGTHFTENWASITEANKVLSMAQINWAMAPNYRYVFNSTGLGLQNIAVPGWICKNYSDAIKRYVIAMPDDPEGPKFSGDAMKSPYDLFSGVSPQVFFFPRQTQDFNSVATKVLSMNPTLFTAIGGPESLWGQVFSAMRKVGYKGLMFAPPPVSIQTLKEILSPEALEGIINGAQVTDFDLPSTQEAKDLNIAWKAKYGRQDGPATMTYFGLYFCLKSALQRAGSVDVDKVAAMISGGMKFDSPTGTIQMINRPDVGIDRTVDSVSTYYIKQMINGRPKLLATIGPDEALGYFRIVHPPLPPGVKYTTPPVGGPLT